MYDVAISYASEDTDLADTIASRFRQDGIRCFYNPSRMHKLLGLPLPDGLTPIYRDQATFVVVIFSRAFWAKPIPQAEYKAAVAGGRGRIIPVLREDGCLPDDMVRDGIAYADARTTEAHLLATQISQRIAEHLPPRQPLGRLADTARQVEAIEVLDNPTQPYALEDVQFFAGATWHRIDVSDDADPEPRLALAGPQAGRPPQPGTEVEREALYAAIDAGDVKAAKQSVRDRLAERDMAGWPVFNGEKFGVLQLRRSRDAKTEHHRIAINVYKTDYHTHLFGRRLYHRLRDRIDFASFLNRGGADLSGLLTSFGLNIMVVAPLAGQPQLILTRRSVNVANPLPNNDVWHVSVNEGVSLVDGYSDEFTARPTFYRGLTEELNITATEVQRAELLEPFVEMNNFEFAMLGVAYVETEADEVLRAARRASDSVLEVSSLRLLPATKAAVTAFLDDTATRKTNILEFALRSMLARDLFL